MKNINQKNTKENFINVLEKLVDYTLMIKKMDSSEKHYLLTIVSVRNKLYDEFHLEIRHNCIAIHSQQWNYFNLNRNEYNEIYKLYFQNPHYTSYTILFKAVGSTMPLTLSNVNSKYRNKYAKSLTEILNLINGFLDMESPVLLKAL